MQEIKDNNGNSVYSNHILNTGQAYGSITGTINIIIRKKKKKNHK